MFWTCACACAQKQIKECICALWDKSQLPWLRELRVVIIPHKYTLKCPSGTRRVFNVCVCCVSAVVQRPHDGPGEMGKPVVIPKDQQEKMKELFKINQFNLMASELIALNRTLPDVRLEGWVLGYLKPHLVWSEMPKHHWHVNIAQQYYIDLFVFSLFVMCFVMALLRTYTVNENYENSLSTSRKWFNYHL